MKYTGLLIVLALFFLSSHPAFADSCKIKSFEARYKDSHGQVKKEKSVAASKKLENSSLDDCTKLVYEAEFSQCHDIVNRKIANIDSIYIYTDYTINSEEFQSPNSCDYVLNVRRPIGVRVASDPGKD